MYLLQTLGAIALYPGPGEEPAAEPLLRGSKTLVLVAYLAQRSGRTASREHLAELFWPGRPARGRRSLRQALYYLARSGGEGILAADGDRVRFRPDLCSVDAERFENALREGRFEEAVGLYAGPYLAGFDAGPSRELAHWIDSVRERLEVGYRQALRESARTSLVRGDPEQAVALGRRAAKSFPLDDGLHALLLEALVAAGRPDEAVREYEAYRVLLREQLEDTPSGDLAEIAERARELSRATTPPQAPIDVRPEEIAATDAGPRDAARGVATTRPPGPGPARRRERRLLVLLAVLLLAVLAAWLLSIVRSSRPDPGPGRTRGPDGDTEPVLLRVQTDTDSFAVLAVTGELPAAARLMAEEEPDALLLISPDGRLRARRVPTSRGPDIAIEDARTGAMVAQVPNRDGRTPDDHIQGWSPDGRFLLFDSGLPTEGGGYDQRLFVFDVARGTIRAVSELQLPPVRAAAWSPRGDAIALVGRPADGDRRDPESRTDLFLVSPGGERLRRLTDDDRSERAPSWSPDGRRIAFQTGPPGEGDVWVIDAEGGEARPVAATAWSEESPVWLSDARIAFVTDRGSGPGLWAVGVDGGEPRRLETGTRVTRVVQRLGPLGTVPWIERVSGGVAAPAGVLSPGEHARLEVEVVASDSTRLPPQALPFAWRSLAADRAEPLGELLLVRDTGGVRLVADLAGWRADTLELLSVPLAAAAGRPALEENWASGIDDRVWRRFGDPAPIAVTGGGPEGGGRLDSNGDANGESGVVSRRRYSLAGGLTVEAWGRIVLTGAMYQTFTVALSRAAEDDPNVDGPAPDVAAIRLMSTGLGAAETAFLESGDLSIGLPEPERLADWRRHALQLHPDGALEWLIDGRRFASARLAGPVPDSAHILLGGRSVGTEIEHGPVRVWTGIRYAPVRNLPDRAP